MTKTGDSDGRKLDITEEMMGVEMEALHGMEETMTMMEVAQGIGEMMGLKRVHEGEFRNIETSDQD